MNSPGLEGTICACATSLPSPIAVIRISGPETFRVLGKIFGPVKSRPRHMVHVEFKIEDFTDDAMMWASPGSSTMTGEDYAEVTLHGSSEIVRRFLKQCFYHGIRQAEKGEFSYRAYLNNRMSLMKALSVASIVGSQSSKDLSAIRDLTNNVVDDLLHVTRDRIITLHNALHVALDFSEQGYTTDELERSIEANISEFCVSLLQLSKRLGPLIEDVQKQRLVIVGPPNVGKSTLFNFLVGYDRVLTSRIPGTTRDYISAHVRFDNRSYELIDTAGLRKTSDYIESRGVAEAVNVVSQATGIIWMLELPNFIEPKDYFVAEFIKNGVPMVILGNKKDLAMPKDTQNFTNWSKEITQFRECSKSKVSSLKVRNESLFSEIGSFFNKMIPYQLSSQCLLPQSIRLLCQELFEQGKLCSEHLSRGEYDLAHVMLEQLMPKLAVLTGEISKEEIYERLFSSFCLGK